MTSLTCQLKRIVVFISGNGTNLQEILDRCESGDMFAKVVMVVSNNVDAKGVERARNAGVPVQIVNSITPSNGRECLDPVIDANPDVIVLAGFMKVLPSWYIEALNGRSIINLHPSLPGEFPGTNAIERAWNAHQQDPKKFTRSGIMVHHVIPEIDAGEVVVSREVQIHPDDDLESFRNRIRVQEKAVLIQGIKEVLNLKSGKVKNVIELPTNMLAMVYTDRLSSFDRHICDLPGKGTVLCETSRFWFNATRHIIPNHYLYSINNVMIVKKCKVIPIEVVIRGYITGSTSTSLWTHYLKGERRYCGILFPDGLEKNQKLDEPVVTPTTKDDIHDELISREEIIERKIVTRDQWSYIESKALELFKFGQAIAASRGLLLVDTKYEFGYDSDNNILLIDEIHTCDSSRFWKDDTYAERFANGQEPEKFDKDLVRDYLRGISNYDPYSSPDVPKIPVEVKQKTIDAYLEFYSTITGVRSVACPVDNEASEYQINDYLRHSVPKAVILYGSESDLWWVDKITASLDSVNVPYLCYQSSAHKQTHALLKIIDKHNNDSAKLVYITVAGRSNALSGVVTGNTHWPVIACPPFKDKLDMMVNVNSTLQMPSKIPVLTVLDPGNVGYAVERILR